MGTKHDDFVRFRVNRFSWLSDEKGPRVNESPYKRYKTESLIVATVGLCCPCDDLSTHENDSPTDERLGRGCLKQPPFPSRLPLLRGLFSSFSNPDSSIEANPVQFI